MRCTHDAAERDVASEADGLCPLCLKAENERLRAVLQPFANGAKEIPANWPNTRALLIDEKHPDNPKSYCLLLAYVEDFRRSEDAIEQPTEKEK